MIAKVVKYLFPNLLSALNIIRGYLFDCRKFIKFNTNNNYKASKTKQRAILIRMCHGLEKAFSLPNMKKKFGVAQCAALIDEAMDFYNKYGSDLYIDEAMVILSNYFRYHEFCDDGDILDLKSRYMMLVGQIGLDETFVRSCFLEQQEVSRAQFAFSDFEVFFNSRFSTRSFKPLVIESDCIRKSISLAEKTPSACNRQPWKVRVLQNKIEIQKALSFQNGNRGFSEQIHNLIIITGVVSNFSSKERSQVHIDCGMFSQSLILAFHAYGISSCPLNMSYQVSDALLAYKGLALDEDEVPIMMLALGYAADDAKYAISQRKHISDVLSSKTTRGV